LLALLLGASGCAYFRPEPDRLPSGESSDEHSRLARQDDAAADDGFLGLLEAITFDIFKGYQEAGR
jgi:hypothetical protein